MIVHTCLYKAILCYSFPTVPFLLLYHSLAQLSFHLVIPFCYTLLYFSIHFYIFLNLSIHFLYLYIYTIFSTSPALPFSCTVLFPTSSDCGNQATPFYLPPNTKLLSANILQHWDFHCFPPGFLLFYPHVELMNPNTHKIYTIFSRSTQFMFVAKTFCHTHKWEG